MPPEPRVPRPEAAGEAAAALVRLMSRLRAACPWDRKQTWADLSGYLLEECHEALEALARGSLRDLEGELGDLLFQIVFLAELGRESDAFDLASVAERIHAKMVSRHPHVFGESEVSDAGAVKVQWEKLKEKERAGQAGEAEPPSPFEGVPRALPALLKAARVTSRAADLGFDWQRDADVLAKLDEEVAEFKAELLAEGATRDSVANEIGDILFTVVNVARRHGVDPEAALQATNAKFVRRFEEVSRRVRASGRDVRDTPLEELDRTWDEVKRGEAP
ncbi:MAG TPA: nucleoside triphosphate pyrophosphohydrolase [Thermoanaerobaculia bacterium]|nr:nucleoside triphosphate pyrophosphohydrolase [Thermoanaerobaculia bacterium]HPA50679.1 nucleoside triphosphate pyrophosphohydrolase [Thermoanaerobaculia bacterium]HQN07157.1 nucleoside triphosphate pyrophosphohydrolase [Thermoanaerobaculia bacterium]HQP85688.1 nucleoside triphosphate pyrophosphohydrolase [Thermoanaerobaculia bacterium]